MSMAIRCRHRRVRARFSVLRRLFPAATRRLSLRILARLMLLVVLSWALTACRRDRTPTPTPFVPSPTSPPTATPVPTLPPTPGPYLPPLQYFLPPRAWVVHLVAVDTDDDGVQETIVLYRDSDQPDAIIRGLVVEPPIAGMPTPTPSAGGVILPQVYWLGDVAAMALFQESWDALSVADINGDGRSEMLLEGHWDAETAAVHVLQWDGQGYLPLLSFQARGELTIEEDDQGQLRFVSLERLFPRSGIITRGLAIWQDGRYGVLHETTWEAVAPPDAPHPEAATVHYYQALGAEDVQAARRWWSDALQAQLDAEALADRLTWRPDLRLERLTLLEETEDIARVVVTLRWTNPFSGAEVWSEDETWEIVRQTDGWRLARLNGTPLAPEWQTFTTDDGLSENLVNDLLLDRQGRLWIACGRSGLTVWSDPHWFTVRRSEDSLASDSVHAMLLDPQGRYWFATAAGVTRYDGLRWLTTTTADGLPDDEVYALAADAQGNVWAGTASGAARYDGQSAWRPLDLPDDVSSAQVSACAVDSEGALWLALDSEEGVPAIARYDGDTWLLFGPEDGLVGDRVSALAVAPDGSLWAAMAGDSRGGLGVWTGAEWRVQTAFDVLVDVSVYDIAFDARGAVWIGTGRGAAYGFGDTWLAYTRADGLADGPVTAILVGPDNVMYFGTANGLTRFRDAVPLQVIGGGQ